jgi:surface polysaccharide O-acyltransferase-like enzyme
VSSDSLDPFAGGLAWQALLTATLDEVTAVALSIWLLGSFQHRFDRAGRVGSAMARAAFGAYVLQAPVLVAIAVSVSDVAIAPELKFLAVAPVAVGASFGLAWVLARVPGVNRVL